MGSEDALEADERQLAALERMQAEMKEQMGDLRGLLAEMEVATGQVGRSL